MYGIYWMNYLGAATHEMDAYWCIAIDWQGVLSGFRRGQ